MILIRKTVVQLMVVLLLEDKVWIGINSTILPGVTVGYGSIVGANSVVTHDVSPYTVVGGNPAKFIKEIRLKKQM